MTKDLPDNSDLFSQTRQLLSGKTVLVVEDNDINAKVVCQLLEAAGIETEVAINGQEALALVSEKFAAVLMDVEMPVLDGLSATRLLRQMPPYEKLPVIAMTGYGHESDRLSCQEAGMDFFLIKPIEPATLLTTLSCAIAQKQGNSTAIAPLSTESHISTEILNSRQGIENLGDNQQFYQEIAQDFLTDHGETVVNISKSIDEGDFKQAHALSHLLKGVAATIQAGQLTQKSQTLATLLKQHPERQTAITTALENLTRVFSQTRDQIRLFLKG